MTRDAPDLFELRVGSLFSGFGGLDLGVREVLGGDVVWHSDIKPAACRLLEQRWPGAPNLGDLTLIDFREVTPVDVLTFGWPCQPHSSAGKRLGADDPRALWPVVARAADRCRPVVLVGENVARVATNGELRRVVRSLAEIGYVGAWRCVPASDLVGAPHKRDRLLLVAIDARADPERLHRLAAAVAADATRVGRRERRTGATRVEGRPDVAVSGDAAPDAVGAAGGDKRRRVSGPNREGPRVTRHDGESGTSALLPTPRAAANGMSARAMTASSSNGRRTGGGQSSMPGLDEVASLLAGVRPDHLPADENLSPASRRIVSSLLPTPTARDHKGTGEGWAEKPGRPLSETVHRLLPTPTQNMTTGPGTSGRDGGLNLQTAATLLPTPNATDGQGGVRAVPERRTHGGRDHGPRLRDVGPLLADSARWGDYADAIARWEHVTGRPAPDPTQDSHAWLAMLERRRAGIDRRPVGYRGPLTRRPQLSPRFVEWMMGVPEGHVTECVNLSATERRPRTTPASERNAMLSLLGDGVVVPWVSAQVRHLLPLVLNSVCAA